MAWQFRVWSQADIERRIFRPTDLVVSITEPGAPDVEFRSDPAAVHRMRFHDVDRVYENPYGLKGIVAPSREAIQAAIDFIRSWHGHEPVRNTVDTVHVHCMAGISRSPAVAFGLAQAIGQPLDWNHFLLAFPCHNRLIIQLFNEVLGTAYPNIPLGEAMRRAEDRELVGQPEATWPLEDFEE